METPNLISLGAAELIRRMRTRQISPLEVLEAHIARIERVNPHINALVTPDFERARQEARRMEARLSAEEPDLPPLFGLPVTVKDALPVAGLRFTGGSTWRSEVVADADAESVRRLRQAGAIILGKTNCADASGSTETHNLLFGLTRNPWNPARSAGGSSGGEGALVAAGGSPLGLGSDIAGSIRIPAAFNGALGLKPTGGRINIDGHFPEPPPAIRGWNTVGPLARRVEDLALALGVLSETPVRDHRSIDLRGHTLVVPEYPMIMPPGREITGAVESAAAALAQAGMQVRRRVKLPFTTLAFEYVALMNREWLPGYRTDLGGGRPIHLLPELLANTAGRGRVSPATLALYASVSGMGAPLRLFGVGRFERVAGIRRQVLAAMGPGGLLVWPVFPLPAPRHGFAWGPYGSPAYTAVFNVLEFPVVVLPVGLTRAGLPLAVQVVAPPGEDETALAAAAVLETAFGGWKLPPL